MRGAVPQVAAGLLLIARETNRVLLTLRSAAVNNPSVWSVPGGSVDMGELIGEAAMREAYEEVGHQGPLHLVGTVDVDFSQRVVFHTVLAFVDTEFRPTLNWESDHAGWFDLDDLPTPLHPGLKRTLHRRMGVICHALMKASF